MVFIYKYIFAAFLLVFGPFYAGLFYFRFTIYGFAHRIGFHVRCIGSRFYGIDFYRCIGMLNGVNGRGGVGRRITIAGRFMPFA